MVLVAKKKRSPSIHLKRRHGQHHAVDDRYHKAYWPYLPMAIVVSIGIFANAFWGTIQHGVLSYATNTSISGLLQETNEERVSVGLANLGLNTRLNQAAQAKANDMASRDYWSHNTPDGNPPWVFFANAGYQYQTAGENLAYGFGNSTETVIGWMNSPGHKANILNTTYTEVGFGIANAENYQGTGPETIVVAMYGSPQVIATPAPTTPKPAPHAQAKPAPTATPAPAKQAPISEPTTPKQEEIATEPVIVNDTKGTAQPAATPRNVSRVQLLSGGTAPWSMFAVSTIATVSIVIFFLKHGLMWRRVLVKSEVFVHKHPILDVTLVIVATVGVVLTRTSGIIR
jgi:uncharacterized protein YkwD